jgi:hypothetical protein
MDIDYVHVRSTHINMNIKTDIDRDMDIDYVHVHVCVTVHVCLYVDVNPLEPARRVFYEHIFFGKGCKNVHNFPLPGPILVLFFSGDRYCSQLK